MAQTVLVADDSPTIQRRASEVLTAHGFEVVTVSNGVAAIKKLPTVKPALVLADVSMPGKDGYEVCDFVKNSPDLSHVPVLLVESADEPYNDQRGASVRADGSIKKPFNSHELMSAVAKLLSMAEAPVAAGPPRPPEPPGPDVSVVAEPVEVEPLIEPKSEKVDITSLSEGIAFAEPALEEIPEAFPEPIPTGTGAEPAVPLAPEFPIEMAPAAEETRGVPFVEEGPLPSEPLLIEEPPPSAAGPPSAPVTERTLILRTPAEIAEPILSDDLAPAPPFPEPARAAREAAVAHGAETPPEAPAPAAPPTAQAEFAPPEAPAPPQVEAPPVASDVTPQTAELFSAAEATAESAAEKPASVAPAVPLDTALVHSVVLKVVTKMAPPVLSPEMIRDLARTLADEVIAELSSGSPTVQ